MSARAKDAALACSWSIWDLKATYSAATEETTISYRRTNPMNATVQVVVDTTPVGNVADSGTADCSGSPQSWPSDTPALTGYKVVAQLLYGGAVMAQATVAAT
jgi:hypothetical protein